MTHAPNPQHLPPERSAAELEGKIAALTVKLQGLCTHDHPETEKDGPQFRRSCPVCGLATDWQYRDSGNSRTLLENLWRKQVNIAKHRAHVNG